MIIKNLCFQPDSENYKAKFINTFEENVNKKNLKQTLNL